MQPRQRPLGLFLAVTFAWTWGLQVPAVLVQRGLLPGSVEAMMPLAGLGILGPLVAALVATSRDSGRAGMRQLVGRYLLWKVPARWYALGLLGPAVLLTGFLALLALAGRTGPVAYLPTASGLALGVVISAAEELGWRGFAQERFEQRFGVMGGRGLLGVVWYLWHLPMFAGAGVPLDLVLPMVLFFTGGSLFIGWIYEKSSGSVLLAAVAHLGAHLNNSHRALPGDLVPLLVHGIVFAGLGLWVSAPWSCGRGPSKFARSSLSPGASEGSA